MQAGASTHTTSTVLEVCVLASICLGDVRQEDVRLGEVG